MCFIKVKSYCIHGRSLWGKFRNIVFKVGKLRGWSDQNRMFVDMRKWREGLEFLTFFVDIMNEWPFMLRIKIILQKSLVQLQNTLLMSKWILNFLKSIKYLAVIKLNKQRFSFRKRKKVFYADVSWYPNTKLTYVINKYLTHNCEKNYAITWVWQSTEKKLFFMHFIKLLKDC